MKNFNAFLALEVTKKTNKYSWVFVAWGENTKQILIYILLNRNYILENRGAGNERLCINKSLCYRLAHYNIKASNGRPKAE